MKQCLSKMASLGLLCMSLSSVNASAGDAKKPPTPAAQISVDAQYTELLIAGATAAKTEKPDEAFLLFQKAYDLKPTPLAVYSMARAKEVAGRDEDALKYYTDYLKLADKDPERASKTNVAITGIRSRLDAKAAAAALAKEKIEEARKAEEQAKLDKEKAEAKAKADAMKADNDRLLAKVKADEELRTSEERRKKAYEQACENRPREVTLPVFIGLGATAALAGGGGYMTYQAQQNGTAWTTPAATSSALTATARASEADSVRTQQIVGFGLFGGAIATGLFSAGWFLFGPQPECSIDVSTVKVEPVVAVDTAVVGGAK